MANESFTVSLRIFHPTSPHEAIAEALGLKADFGHTVGHPRMTPTGRPLEGVNKNTYCCFKLLPKQAGDFVEGVRQLLATLKIHRFFLRKVTADGGKAELFVGVFAEESTGFTLCSEDMSALVDLSLNLSVESYF